MITPQPATSQTIAAPGDPANVVNQMLRELDVEDEHRLTARRRG